MSAAPVEPKRKRNCQLLSQLFSYQIVPHSTITLRPANILKAVQETCYGRTQKSTLLVFLTYWLMSSPLPSLSTTATLRWACSSLGLYDKSGERVLTAANSGLGVLSHCNVTKAPRHLPNYFCPDKDLVSLHQLENCQEHWFKCEEMFFKAENTAQEQKSLLQTLKLAGEVHWQRKNVTSLRGRDEEWPPEYHLQE